jgi:hypothetical protein
MDGEGWQNAILRAKAQLTYETQLGGRKKRATKKSTPKRKKSTPKRKTPTKKKSHKSKRKSDNVKHYNPVKKNGRPLCNLNMDSGRCTKQTKDIPKTNKSFCRLGNKRPSREYEINGYVGDAQPRFCRITDEGRRERRKKVGSDEDLYPTLGIDEGYKEDWMQGKDNEWIHKGGRKKTTKGRPKKTTKGRPKKTTKGRPKKTSKGRPKKSHSSSSSMCKYNPKTHRCGRTNKHNKDPNKCKNSKGPEGSKTCVTKGGSYFQQGGYLDNLTNTSSTRSSDFTNVSNTTSYTMTAGSNLSYTTNDNTSLW